MKVRLYEDARPEGFREMRTLMTVMTIPDRLSKTEIATYLASKFHLTVFDIEVGDIDTDENEVDVTIPYCTYGV